MRYLVSGLVAGFLLSISLITKQEKMRRQSDSDLPKIGTLTNV